MWITAGGWWIAPKSQLNELLAFLILERQLLDAIRYSRQGRSE